VSVWVKVVARGNAPGKAIEQPTADRRKQA